MVKVRSLITPLALALALLILPTAGLAQAKVTVIHGLSGGILGLDPALPVDVWANDTPLLTDFRFTDVVGPVELPAGSYDLEVFLAGSDPSTTDPVLALSAPLADGDDVTVVAHFTGDLGLALNAYANNSTPQIVDPISPRISERQTRVTVRHLAAFGRVAINRLLPVEPTVASGDTFNFDADPGHYRFWLSPAGSPRPLTFQPIRADLEANTHYFITAVGTPLDGSFQLIITTDTFE